VSPPAPQRQPDFFNGLLSQYTGVFAKKDSVSGFVGLQLGGPVAAKLAFGVARMVDLMGVTAGPEHPQLAAGHHSQKRAAFPGLETGPVKGMSLRRRLRASSMGRFLGVRENAWQTRLRSDQTRGLRIEKPRQMNEPGGA
jgi:hypothetical protein